ncbi:MAG: hypothetical protein COA33_003660 [Fluviicola sp.]|nr:hypothetical protein [Fluviicola sp.]
MMKIKAIFSCIIVLFVTSITFAQHNHGAGGQGQGATMEELLPPHGGQLEDLGKYKIELVTNLYQKKNQLTFFLFKGELKPVSTEGIVGVISLLYANGTVFKDTLDKVGTEFFVGSINSTESFMLTVEFTIKKKVITTFYTHEGIGKISVYTCSMHPEIESGSPGDCPKCGMELIPMDKPEEKQEESHGQGHNHNH